MFYNNKIYYNAKTGDINGDDAVDILDLIRMKKNLVAESSAEDMDLNADKAVNSTDLVCMLKFLLGLIDFK